MWAGWQESVHDHPPAGVQGDERAQLPERDEGAGDYILWLVTMKTSDWSHHVMLTFYWLSRISVPGGAEGEVCPGDQWGAPAQGQVPGQHQAGVRGQAQAEMRQQGEYQEEL